MKHLLVEYGNMLQGDNEFAILTAFRDEFSKKQNLNG